MLTETQKDILHRAIDLAKGYGECEYTMDGKPCCVIGQLAFLTGCSINKMGEWSGQTVDNEDVPNFIGINKYFLKQIQRIWDGTGERMDPERARDKMHNMVDNLGT